VGASLIAMPTCKEVSRSIASDELSAAGWRQRLSTQIHLLMCRHCRRYSHQIRAIGEAARGILSDTTPDSGSRERLRSSILDQISSSAEKDSEPRL
jgi:anti-sigma factor ChrR (cupin superfamily)